MCYAKRSCDSHPSTVCVWVKVCEVVRVWARERGASQEVMYLLTPQYCMCVCVGVGVGVWTWVWV